MGLAFSRQTPENVTVQDHQSSKNVIFFTIKLQNCRLLLTFKMLQGKKFNSHSFSNDLHDLQAPEESLNWKNQFPCSQKHSL